MFKRPIIIVAALAAGALAGCGSSSSSSSSTSFTTPAAPPAPDLTAFKAAFQADKPAFALLGNELATALKNAPGQTNGQLATEFKALARNAAQAEAAVRQLKPPAAYTSQVNGFASGIDAVSADLSALATSAATDTPSKIKAQITKLLTDSASVHAADLALTKQLGLPASNFPTVK